MNTFLLRKNDYKELQWTQFIKLPTSQMFKKMLKANVLN